MNVCPHCGGTGLLPEVDPVERLRATCIARGIWISPDDRIREPDAAALMGLAGKTLCNWRANGSALPHIRRAGRPLYLLADVGAWITENTFPEPP